MDKALDDEKAKQLKLLEAEIHATKSLLNKLEESARELRASDEVQLGDYLAVDEPNSWSLIREELSYELHQIQERLKMKSRLQKS